MSKQIGKHIVFLTLCLSLLIFVGASAEGILKLPKETKVIEEEAFAGLTSAQEVVLPDGLTEIGARVRGERRSQDQFAQERRAHRGGRV